MLEPASFPQNTGHQLGNFHCKFSCQSCFKLVVAMEMFFAWRAQYIYSIAALISENGACVCVTPVAKLAPIWSVNAGRNPPENGIVMYVDIVSLNWVRGKDK